jgi:hypothetical protein
MGRAPISRKSTPPENLTQPSDDSGPAIVSDSDIQIASTQALEQVSQSPGARTLAGSGASQHTLSTCWLLTAPRPSPVLSQAVAEYSDVSPADEDSQVRLTRPARSAPL